MLVANCELGRSERAYRIVIIKADKVLRSCRSKRRRKAYWREKKINRKIKKKKKRPEMGGNEQSEPVGPSEHLGLIHDKNFLFFKKKKTKRKHLGLGNGRHFIKFSRRFIDLRVLW